MPGLGKSVFEKAFKNIDDDLRVRVLVLGSLYEDSLLQTIRGLL